MKYPLGWYLGLLVGSIFGLYILGQGFVALDTAYTIEHSAALTTAETVTLSDGSSVTNYAYSHTPYFLPLQAIGLMSIFLPVVLVFYWSIRYMLVEKNTRRLLYSLSFPLLYALCEGIYFFAVMDPSSGWEYMIGMSLLFVWSGIVFFSIVLINTILLLRSKKRVSSDREK